MNKFEQIGVNLQYDAMNKHSDIPVSAVAQKVYCEHCAIYCTHQLVMACFDSKRK
nr:MAG TPA: hypothetical protein [Caudoviricetes sp.]